MGTHFVVFDDGCNAKKPQSNRRTRAVICNVHYQQNLLHRRNSRKITVYIPDP
jgi:hypothetical protein